MKLEELGEFGLIERIRSKAGSEADGVLGIGDDCAAVKTPPGELLLTSTDLLIEGVHFNPAWTDYYRLGCKAVAVNVSDVAAMGGAPRALYLALAAPPDQSVEQLEELVEGFCDEARRYGATLLGGDTCRSPGPLMLGVTVQGSVAPAQLIRRAGAAPGDLVWVSGTLGDSALALRELQAGGTPSPEVADRHHHPQARAALGRALAEQGLASAMIDVSDGLLADLGHVLRASGVGAALRALSLPLSPRLRRRLASSPQDLALALQGGEDYELLFCSSRSNEEKIRRLSAALELPLTVVGEIRAEPDLEILDLDEAGVMLTGYGFDHFAVTR